MTRSNQGGRGRSGRGSGGRGKGKNSSSQNNKKRDKKTLQDHIFYLGSVTQTSDFVSVNDYLINHIRKTYVNGDDIGNALERLEEADSTEWQPTLVRSNNTDATLKQQEDKVNLIIYKEEVHAFIRR